MQVCRKISNSLFSCLAPCTPCQTEGFNVVSLSLFYLSGIFFKFLISFSLCLSSLPSLFLSFIFILLFSTPLTPLMHFLSPFSDPGAVVETQSPVPYTVIGGVLALLVFTVICILIVTIWCSVRQKGNAQACSWVHTPSKTKCSFAHINWLSKYFITFPINTVFRCYTFSLEASYTKVPS